MRRDNIGRNAGTKFNNSITKEFGKRLSNGWSWNACRKRWIAVTMENVVDCVKKVDEADPGLREPIQNSKTS